METYSIVKYFFPILALLQYIGCDSYSDLSQSFVDNEPPVMILENDCLEVSGYVYNGLYKPQETGRLFVKKKAYTIDSVMVSESPVIGLKEINSVAHGFDASGYPNIQMTFTENGKELFKEYTSKNMGQKMAIILNNELVSAPVIAEEIQGGKVEISGNFTNNEVDTLHRYLSKMIRCAKSN